MPPKCHGVRGCVDILNTLISCCIFLCCMRQGEEKSLLSLSHFIPAEVLSEFWFSATSLFKFKMEN